MIIQRICKECVSQCRCTNGYHGRNVKAFTFNICGFCGKDGAAVAHEADKIMGALRQDENDRREKGLESSKEYSTAYLSWHNAMTWPCDCDLRKCPSCGKAVQLHDEKKNGYKLISDSIAEMRKCAGYKMEDLPARKPVRTFQEPYIEPAKVSISDPKVDWSLVEAKRFEDECKPDFKAAASGARMDD